MSLTWKAKSGLTLLVEEVVYQFACEIDPDDERYPDMESLSELRADLEEVLDGRIWDWEIEQREKHGKEK